VSSKLQADGSKLVQLPVLLCERAGHAAAGRSVVLTNGCFDLLHPGHIHLLVESAKLGDILVVALNSDDSVRRLKGQDRPVDNLEVRLAKLGDVSCVDRIIVFEEGTPTILIRSLEPDILVKGGDYTIDQVVGREIVEASGGLVVTIPLLEGHSTTDSLNPNPGDV